MLANGIRTDVGDLDLIARGDSWERALRLGTRLNGPLNGAPMVQFRGGRIEVSEGWVGELDVNGLIDGASRHSGIRFAQLPAVLAYKRILSRAKDADDIGRLEQRIGTQAGSDPLTFDVRRRGRITGGGVVPNRRHAPVDITATSRRHRRDGRAIPFPLGLWSEHGSCLNSGEDFDDTLPNLHEHTLRTIRPGTSVQQFRTLRRFEPVQFNGEEFPRYFDVVIAPIRSRHLSGVKMAAPMTP